MDPESVRWDYPADEARPPVVRSLESDLGTQRVGMRRPAVAGRTRLLATSDRRSSSRPGASRRTIARKIVWLFRRPVGCVTWAGERRWP